MDMDFSARFPSSSEIERICEDTCIDKRSVTYTDEFYYPAGKDVSIDFNPRDVVIRLRVYEDSAKLPVLEKVDYITRDNGYYEMVDFLGEAEYQTLLKRVAKFQYKPWGKLRTESTLYYFKMNDEEVIVEIQRLENLGEYVKIKAPKKGYLEDTLTLLNVQKESIIKTNAAALYYESVGSGDTIRQ